MDSNNTGRNINKWLASNKMGQLVIKLFTILGNVLHAILFGLLLPKRHRGLTRKDIYTIIFKSDSPEGRKFDLWLLGLIGFNLLLIILDSVPKLHDNIGLVLRILEWCCTIVFTFEYYLRIYCLRYPWKYIFSFYGIIDFLSIFPVYLSIFVSATQTLSVLRLLRLLRLFRILKLQRFIDESGRILSALRRSMYKTLIFMLFVFITAVILGAIVYTIEEGKNPNITSIPLGVYWAVVTLTTVGYGDISPVTPVGQFISMVVMLLGYSIIAVPTGIVTGEVVNAHNEAKSGKARAEAAEQRDYKKEDDAGEETVQETQAPESIGEQPHGGTLEPVSHCPHCGHDEFDADAIYCKHCGTRLDRINNRSWISDFFAQ
ncbi:MAG: ion transporter [Bacteroidales bacterium]|nr:ion transporter [Bacteroidales bacterium]